MDRISARDARPQRRWPGRRRDGLAARRPRRRQGAGWPRHGGQTQDRLDAARQWHAENQRPAGAGTMNFPRFFIDRPIFAIVLSVLLLIAGLLALLRLPLSDSPAVAPPTVTVAAAYPGASPEVKIGRAHV